MNENTKSTLPPIATLYRPNISNPTFAPFALFIATNITSMADLYDFADKIGARRLIAICPYFQYFDCMLSADNIILCEEKNINHLVSWLENPIKGFIDIECNDFEIGLKAHKFCYFSYFQTTKNKPAIQFKPYMQYQSGVYFPKKKMQFLIVDIDADENFNLEAQTEITNIVNDIIDTNQAAIFYGLTFGMPSDDYTIHLLTA